MCLPGLLLGVPLLAALLVFCIRNGGARNFITIIAAVATMALSVATAVTYLGQPSFISLPGDLPSTVIMAVDIIVALAIF